MRKKYIILSLILITVGALTACSKQAQTNTIPSSSRAQLSSATRSKSSEAATDSSSASTVSSSEIGKVKVTVKEVIDIFKQAHHNADITSLELDSKSGKYLYTIEGVDADKEYEMDIDASTKEVTKNKDEHLDREAKSEAERKEDALDTSDVISVGKAISIAEGAAGFGKATELKLDKELNVTYWSVSVKEGTKEMDIKINAKTGDVLEVEND
ncbi:PepSY domain-containing protein [Vagococcus vulneris]|nr:PepSY domain-containing protein [Vagococcus vulneris]